MIFRQIDNNITLMIKAARLRYDIFHNRLGWIPEDRLCWDIDSHDLDAAHFAILDSNVPGDNLVCTFRAIQRPHPFMLDHEFSGLIDKGCTIMAEGNVIEISRLCKSSTHSKILPVIMKTFTEWCLRRNIQYIYTVIVSDICHRLSEYGVRFDVIGEDPGARAVAILIDLYNKHNIEVYRNIKLV